ncbi:MAG TPA: nucleoside hydrolase [Chloroflexaceae bacterium]|nr:nucleoside hydrolase [Chloroflexaceae bacterium]
MLPPRRIPAIVAIVLVAALAFAALAAPTEASRQPPAGPLFVDTDIGVDDAIAIAWLLDQPRAELVGFTTVFGNTSVENATRNLLTLLGAAGEQYPVTVGAADPLALPRTRTGALVHGPDGLWFAQQPADISALPNDAPAAMAAAARANPGLTIVALGPLTNVARAVERFPADMAGVRLVALGGAQRGGNRTPVAEFNIFADPHALAVVLAGDMRVELLTLDAFTQVTVDPQRFIRLLNRRGDAVGGLLAHAFGLYVQAQQLNNSSGRNPIPDAAAVVYALHPELGSAQSALVKVIADDGLARGQTLIATDLSSRMPLIAGDAELSSLADQAFTPGFDLNAALGAILMREPDNAQAVLDVQEGAMVRLVERGLFR